MGRRDRYSEVAVNGILLYIGARIVNIVCNVYQPQSNSNAGYLRPF